MNSKVKIIMYTLMLLSSVIGCAKPDTNYASVKPKVSINIQQHRIVRKTVKRKTKSKRRLWNVPMDYSEQMYLSQLCKKYNVSERLAYAVIKKESNFKSYKISNTGDFGLFQVNRINKDELCKKLGVTNLLNPYQNIKSGLYLLSHLKHKYIYNNIVLLAYHLGETGMRRAIRSGIYQTQYTRDVFRNMSELSVS